MEVGYMNTKNISDLGTSKIIARAIELGYSVALPFGDNQRYDLILVKGKTALLAQCKTGRIRNGAMLAKECSNDHRSKRASQPYKGQVDIFLVYCRDNGKIYKANVDEMPTNEIYLRIDPPKNGHIEYRSAEAYEFNEDVA